MKKVFGIICLILSFLFIGMGTFSYYSTTITLDSGVIANDLVLNVTGSDYESTNTYVLNEGNLLMPGDSGEFDITIDVGGSSSDVYCELSFDKKNIPTNLNFYLDEEHTILLNKYFKVFDINESTKENITVYWYWDGSISDEVDNRFMGKSIDATFTVNALQLQYSYIKNGSFSKEAFWSDEYRDKIRTVSFGFLNSDMPICLSVNLCFDVSSEDSPNKVFAYLVDSGYKDDFGNILYDLKIEADAFIFAPTDLSYFFSDFTNLVSIDFKTLKTINTTDMSYMFNNCFKLEELNLNSFSTSRVNDMRYMFNNCNSLKNIDLTSFDTSRVIYMNGMFKNNSSIINLDISNFVSPRVSDVNSMFYGMTSLELLNMRNFAFEYSLTSNRDNYINLFTLVNDNSKVIVKNSQEQAFILGLGFNFRPSTWNSSNVCLY